ncbi:MULTISPECIES: biopolymer transporter ExbD [unclassified Oleiphilus]|jgi:biopolymer transport protein ExbD|uniref:ExbD/TolR family protein n=2 Tax=Oleiphilus TaxID=141450 RepID=UPI0007C28E29|nr:MULTISPECIES: biopolymer transporter ExbD [unclassified Oleiphilus]KZY46487.1 biopolymer transporter ExbD [Oleiphilus sp. HI0050]KZY79534.1 biopolymer transporter ExbD [Oleiphilus sp. HI0069]KZY84659.1 biopolymer transporter ExbD [Oleiphilus sp. HI0068]KZY88893.1 biopolymer transporter ExbD [Oleiphilus sp. HI0072]KZZ11621.1 biopolymer transporter ExbD [Oleiphilus sp. HI0078]KZZ27371.1 biopolymer transporter ExbD [Oleiphilus sp. HI0081]
MARRKHRKLVQQAELDITAFMNLMIVLVPVLLLSMVFSQTAVLDLNFPVLDDAQLPDNSEELQLQLIIRKNSLTLADTKQGLIRKIQSSEQGYDFDSLVKVLKQLKNRFPEKTDITLLLGEEINYQTLVSAMDLTRSYETVVAASVVNAELFPDISIGDAPILDVESTGGGATP